MIENKIPAEELERRTTPRANDIRGCYYRDQTAILHSKPFRRLKHKTQVFFSPNDDHICTRIEHVLHVATIAATICRGLNSKGTGWQLNEDLAYAISLGHDLGHTPFGHSGEKAIANLLGGRDKFMHEVNSYRVVEKLIDGGRGLNLTYAVKDGIICHNGEKYEQFITPDTTVKDLDAIRTRHFLPSTYEGVIVRFSDKFAYLGRDIEDAMVAGFINSNDIPLKIRDKVGGTNSDIINFLVNDVVANSTEEAIAVSDEAFEMMLELIRFNSQRIYSHPLLKEVEAACENIIVSLFHYLYKMYGSFDMATGEYDGMPRRTLETYFADYMKTMRPFYLAEAKAQNLSAEETGKQIVTDYLSGMTDRFAIDCMHEISIPQPIFFRHGKGTF